MIRTFSLAALAAALIIGTPARAVEVRPETAVIEGPAPMRVQPVAILQSAQPLEIPQSVASPLTAQPVAIPEMTPAAIAPLAPAAGLQGALTTPSDPAQTLDGRLDQAVSAQIPGEKIFDNVRPPAGSAAGEMPVENTPEESSLMPDKATPVKGPLDFFALQASVFNIDVNSDWRSGFAPHGVHSIGSALSGWARSEEARALLSQAGCAGFKLDGVYVRLARVFDHGKLAELLKDPADAANLARFSKLQESVSAFIKNATLAQPTTPAQAEGFAAASKLSPEEIARVLNGR